MGYLWLYGGVAAIILAIYLHLQKRSNKQAIAELEHSEKSGLAEPPSLHPIVDPALCIGSSSCTRVCPEEALGIVNGKAVLVNAAACIGHGACMAACPFDAIKLVFGTEKRGIDIPNVKPSFETNVPGLFIAGELGGMGLIRKAAEQGRQAIQSIKKIGKGEGEFDVVIVGCGPAGLSAGLSAIHHKLRYKLLEQEDSLGGAVYHYPRQKIAMTAPVTLDLIGQVRFGEVQKEKLLEFWNDVVRRTGLQVAFSERMEEVRKVDSGFIVQTNKGEYSTKSVLLTMGRRGSPRKLEVPGEESAKVTYRLVDPAQYAGQSVLVVGGGDSALEAAIALADQPDTQVILSYRGEAFSRVKQKNREQLQVLQSRERVKVLLASSVVSIDPRHVHLSYMGEKHTYPNDAVIVCAGGLLPTPILQRMGIAFETKFGSA